MRPLGILAIYLFVVFVGGALLAPWIHAIVVWGAHFSDFFKLLEDNPFHRFVNRSLLIIALCGLWPFFKALGVRRASDVGLETDPRILKDLLKGMGIALGSLTVLVGIGWLLGVQHPRTDIAISKVLQSISLTIISGLFVGFLEEILFRGALFGALRKTMPWVTALVLSSAFYAVVHFFQRPASPTPVEWDSGLVVLARMMRGFVDFHILIPGFVNLTGVGVLLGLAYQRTQLLFCSIGLHAGWIMGLKISGILFIRSPEASTWLWGRSNLVDGWAGLIVIMLVAGWLILGHAQAPQRPSANEQSH